MRIFDLFRNFIYFALNTIAAAGAKQSNCQRVAFVKVDAIGDFLVWLNAAEAASQKYGANNSILITSTPNEGVANALPFWSEVILIDKPRFLKNAFYRYKMLRKIRSLGIKTAIHFTHSREFRVGDAIIWATGAKDRIGLKGDMSNISASELVFSDVIYSNLHAVCSGTPHEAIRHQEFMHSLGISDYAAGIFNLNTPAIPKTQKRSNDYFIVFPGASWEGRQWEKDKFIQLIDRVSSLTQLECILAGGQNEIDLCDSIIQSSSEKINITSLAGKVNFVEFLDLVRTAKFLISNDSSGIHAAAVMGTRSVCISGGGHFGRFIPYEGFTFHNKPTVAFHKMSCFNCDWKCNQEYSGSGPVPCIKKISVDDVYSACKTVWMNPSN